MTYDIKEVIRILKDKRIEKNWSLRDLASQTGISPSTLQRYENLETPIPLDKFKVMCAALDLQPDTLLRSRNNDEVKTAARDKKILSKFNKLEEQDRQIIENMIDSLFEKLTK